MPGFFLAKLLILNFPNRHDSHHFSCLTNFHFQEQPEEQELLFLLLPNWHDSHHFLCLINFNFQEQPEELKHLFQLLPNRHGTFPPVNQFHL